MIEFHAVSKRYPGGHEALREVNTHIERGDMVFLTGHSGAGKSTLLRLVSRMEEATSGHVVVAGTNLARLPRARIPYLRRRIGFVFQDHRLLLDRSVFDNVALPLVLSAGEQQRVGIARAVVGRPPILLADEPTGNLDPELSLEIMRLFGQFNQIGVTVIVATHDLGLLRRMRGRMLELRGGELVGEAALPLQ